MNLVPFACEDGSSPELRYKIIVPTNIYLFTIIKTITLLGI